MKKLIFISVLFFFINSCKKDKAQDGPVVLTHKPRMITYTKDALHFYEATPERKTEVFDMGDYVTYEYRGNRYTPDAQQLPTEITDGYFIGRNFLVDRANSRMYYSPTETHKDSVPRFTAYQDLNLVFPLMPASWMVPGVIDGSFYSYEYNSSVGALTSVYSFYDFDSARVLIYVRPDVGLHEVSYQSLNTLTSNAGNIVWRDIDAVAVKNDMPDDRYIYFLDYEKKTAYYFWRKDCTTTPAFNNMFDAIDFKYFFAFGSAATFEPYR